MEPDPGLPYPADGHPLRQRRTPRLQCKGQAKGGMDHRQMANYIGEEMRSTKYFIISSK